MAITSFTFRGVAFDVMNVTSPNFQFGQDSTKLTVTMRIPWANRFIARDALLGYVKVGSQSGTKYLSRFPPHQWTEIMRPLGGDSLLYCRAISSTKGLGTASEAQGNYVYAEMTCEYMAAPFDFLEDSQMPGQPPDESTLMRYVEFGDRDYEGRLVASAGLGAVFCDPISDVPDSPQPRAVTHGSVFPFYEETIIYIWHQIPVAAAPLAVASSMLNKINNATFDIYSARTLMFLGVKPQRIRFPNLERGYNLEYRFKYNRFGWNRLPDPRNGMRWDRVVRRDDYTKGLFEEADFGNLFRPV